jgi:hypothetical protein
MKKVLVISDLHCGHLYGLTPPDWQDGNREVLQFQRNLWAFYKSTIEENGPFDILICNGDAIEGKSALWGSRELITADRHEQVRMAAYAINEARAPVVHLTYGTRYHVGKEEDFESILLDLIEAKEKAAHGHLFLRVEDTVLDVKHKVGKSTVPHGRFTTLFRAAVWNILWAESDERQPRADILIRSHVHYYVYCGDRGKLALITPALTYNSMYGIRECEGTVDVGLIIFEIDGDNFSYYPKFLKSKFLKASVHEVK